MKIIATKTKHFSVFIIELVLGMIIVSATIVGLPIGVLFLDSSLFSNLPFMGFILAIMFIFTLIGYFFFVRPYQLYRKMPEIQAQTDGEYLYINSKKKAKIPLADLENAYINSEIPNFMSNQFIIHLLSEEYGNVVIEVPKHGKYRLYYISHASDVASTIIRLAEPNYDNK